jgi:hypothetical protein
MSGEELWLRDVIDMASSDNGVLGTRVPLGRGRGRPLWNVPRTKVTMSRQYVHEQIKYRGAMA